jgi:hypothetical protein
VNVFRQLELFETKILKANGNKNPFLLFIEKDSKMSADRFIVAGFVISSLSSLISCL